MNLLFAVLHLQKASELLKFSEKEVEVSNILLDLARSILDNNNLSEEDTDTLHSEIDSTFDDSCK